MVCLSAGLQLLALCCWAQAQQRIEVIRKCSAAVVVARAQCMVSIKLVAK